MLRNLSVMLLFALALILPTAGAFAQAGNPNPGVIPINAKPHGLSYGEWSARCGIGCFRSRHP